MADQAIPCYQCSAPCCYQYIVGLTGYDAWTISQGMHLAWDEFVILVREEQPTASGFHLDHSETTYDLALAKAKEELIPPGRKQSDGKVLSALQRRPCVFLVTFPGDFGRCGIYEHRPLACRNYPVGMGLGAMHFRQNLPCPPNGWNLALLDLPAWQGRILQSRLETALYRFVVAVWNRRLAESAIELYGAQDYFAFLHTIYDRLAVIRHQIDQADIQEILGFWLNDDAPELEQHPVLRRALQEDSPLAVLEQPETENAWLGFIYASAAAILADPVLEHAK